MTVLRLKKFASLKNWQLKKNIAYGQENGYIFTVIAGQGVKIFICPLPSISEERKSQVLNYLYNNRRELKINEFIFENDVLVIKFKEVFRSTKIEIMNNLVSKLISFLETNEIKGNECCIFCGKNDAHQIIYIDKIMYLAHNKCYTDQLDVLDEAIKEYDTENKNYFRGFIGALIGGGIISIPLSLAQVYFGNIVGMIFSTLLSFGLLKAYYMFKGKLGRGTKWIITLCTFISVIISQIMVVEIGMLQHGSTLKPSNFKILFGITQIADYFKLNVGISLLSALMGFLLIFLQIKGDIKDFLPKIEKK